MTAGGRSAAAGHSTSSCSPRRPGQKPQAQPHDIDSVLHGSLGAGWKAAASVSNDIMHTRVGVVRDLRRLLSDPAARVGLGVTNMEIYSNRR